MKNWLYIPFLILMAVTYTRVSDNFSVSEISPNQNLRGPASVEIEIQDLETNKTLGHLKTSAKQGINSFIVHADNLKKDTEYRVQINYNGNNSSGSFSNSVKAKY